MEPLSVAATYAATFVSPADAKVALPNVIGGLDAGTLLALLAMIVALVPLLLVLRGTRDARRAAPSAPARAKRRRSLLGAPTVVWRGLGVAGRVGVREATRAPEGGVPAARARVLSDRG